MLLSNSLITAVKLMVGAYPRWEGTAPSDKQRIYFAGEEPVPVARAKAPARSRKLAPTSAAPTIFDREQTKLLDQVLRELDACRKLLAAIT